MAAKSIQIDLLGQHQRNGIMMTGFLSITALGKVIVQSQFPALSADKDLKKTIKESIAASVREGKIQGSVETTDWVFEWARI